MAAVLNEHRIDTLSEYGGVRDGAQVNSSKGRGAVGDSMEFSCWLDE